MDHLDPLHLLGFPLLTRATIDEGPHHRPCLKSVAVPHRWEQRLFGFGFSPHPAAFRQTEEEMVAGELHAHARPHWRGLAG